MTPSVLYVKISVFQLLMFFCQLGSFLQCAVHLSGRRKLTVRHFLIKCAYLQVCTLHRRGAQNAFTYSHFKSYQDLVPLLVFCFCTQAPQFFYISVMYTNGNGTWQNTSVFEPLLRSRSRAFFTSCTVMYSVH